MTDERWKPRQVSDGVFIVRIADDVSPWLGADFLDRWETVARDMERNPEARVVVLEGGERNFCLGAHRDTLLVPQAGDRVSNYAATLPLRLIEFPLPTVAAMAGHAIGGGLLIGLWCDAAFFAKESLYGANFMALGFTPGMGSTIALEEALGAGLARDMLYTGRLLKGRDLGATPTGRYVSPRAFVRERALALAEEIAGASRDALMELKKILAEHRRRRCASALDLEADAHRRIFARPETAQRIAEGYARASPEREGQP